MFLGRESRRAFVTGTAGRIRAFVRHLESAPCTIPSASTPSSSAADTAGTEAALASARLGARTLLLTQSIETLGQMSCNPAIGGIGKGHLVREVDALGGLMAIAADHCGIHFRRLNARKGPAVRATRAQIDRALYRSHVRNALETCPNLVLFQQSVEDLLFEGGAVCGVRTRMGLEFRARSVVLTVGTFLGGASTSACRATKEEEPATRPRWAWPGTCAASACASRA